MFTCKNFDDISINKPSAPIKTIRRRTSTHYNIEYYNKHLVDNVECDDKKRISFKQVSINENSHIHLF